MATHKTSIDVQKATSPFAKGARSQVYVQQVKTKINTVHYGHTYLWYDTDFHFVRLNK